MPQMNVPVCTQGAFLHTANVTFDLNTINSLNNVKLNNFTICNLQIF